METSLKTFELTDEELEAVGNAVKEAALDGIDMQKYKDEVQVDTNADLIGKPITEVIPAVLNEIEESILTEDKETENVAYLNGGLSIVGEEDPVVETTTTSMGTAGYTDYSQVLDAIEEQELSDTSPLSEEEIQKMNEEVNIIAGNSVKEQFDLDDEGVMNFINLMENYRKDKNYPVYINLPESMKKNVREVCESGNLPSSQYEIIAKGMLNEIMNDSTMSQAFDELEAGIKEAYNIPSILDVYSEHMSDVMRNKMPELIKVAEESGEPEKADQIRGIIKAYNQAIDYSFAKEQYLANSRYRKAVRRADTEVKRALEEFDFKNTKSEFKTVSATELPKVLKEVFIERPNKNYVSDEETPDYAKIKATNITKQDLNKFAVFITKTADNVDPKDIVGASYLYYIVKNVTVLEYTNEAKTDLSVELINNILDVITFIRQQEAEFYELRSKNKS